MFIKIYTCIKDTTGHSISVNITVTNIWQNITEYVIHYLHYFLVKISIYNNAAYCINTNVNVLNKYTATQHGVYEPLFTTITSLPSINQHLKPYTHIKIIWIFKNWNCKTQLVQ